MNATAPWNCGTVELRTLWSSESLATTLEGRPNVESKQQMVKMSGSTYREVQSARGKPSVAHAHSDREILGIWLPQAARPALPTCVPAKLRQGHSLRCSVVARASRRRKRYLRLGLRTSSVKQWKTCSCLNQIRSVYCRSFLQSGRGGLHGLNHPEC